MICARKYQNDKLHDFSSFSPVKTNSVMSFLVLARNGCTQNGFKEAPKYVRWTAVTKRRLIPVQLLKDFERFGVRGQIIQVQASTMRNKLYPYNGAAYILPNQPAPIPVVSVSESQAKKKELLVEEEEKVVVKEKSQKIELFDSFDDSQSLRELKLGISKTDSPTKSSSAFTQDMLNSLPRVLLFSTAAKLSGYLIKNLEKKDIVKRIDQLVSVNIDPEDITIKYPAHSPSQTELPHIDFIGLHDISINLPGSKAVKRTVNIVSPTISSNKAIKLVRGAADKEVVDKK